MRGRKSYILLAMLVAGIAILVTGLYYLKSPPSNERNLSDPDVFLDYVISLPTPYSPNTPEWFGYMDAYYFDLPPSSDFSRDEKDGAAYSEGYMTGLNDRLAKLESPEEEIPSSSCR